MGKFLSEAIELGRKALQMQKTSAQLIKDQEEVIAGLSNSVQIREEQLTAALKGVTDEMEIKKINDEFDTDMQALEQQSKTAKLIIRQLNPDWGKTKLDDAKDALASASLKTIEAAGNLAGRAGQLLDVAKEAANKQRANTLKAPARPSMLEMLRKA